MRRQLWRLWRRVWLFFRRPKYQVGFKFNPGWKPVTIGTIVGWHKSYTCIADIYYHTDLDYSPSEGLMDFYVAANGRVSETTQQEREPK